MSELVEKVASIIEDGELHAARADITARAAISVVLEAAEEAIYATVDKYGDAEESMKAQWIGGYRLGIADATRVIAAFTRTALDAGEAP